MRKSINIFTPEDLKSVAFDYNAPVFVSPELLINDFIETDEECNKLIANLPNYHENVIAFFFRHEGFRIYFLIINSFVVIKKYTIDNVTIINFKKFAIHSVRFDIGNNKWTEKQFYSHRRGNKPDSVTSNWGYYTAKYTHVYDKTYVSEIRVTDDSLYLVDMKFRRNGREIDLNTLGNDYPEIVSAMRGKVRSIENLTNKSKLIKSYLPIIDMILI